MKESYSEGLASHTDPESCEGTREEVGEALTGARAGRVLSRENELRGADGVRWTGRPHEGRAKASDPSTPRGLRPLACTEPRGQEPGRTLARPSEMDRRSAP
jgi:hypothetical protein